MDDMTLYQAHTKKSKSFSEFLSLISPYINPFLDTNLTVGGVFLRKKSDVDLLASL